jgi:hypothetical protein
MSQGKSFSPNDLRNQTTSLTKGFFFFFGTALEQRITLKKEKKRKKKKEKRRRRLPLALQIMPTKHICRFKPRV